MSLVADADVVNSATMAMIDSEVPAVAVATKPPIIIDGPGSICLLAQIECGMRFIAAQQRYATVFTTVGVSGAHQAAVNNVGGSGGVNQSRSRLNQIVATESQYAGLLSPTQLWMTYVALSLFYRDASSRMKGDRLQVKYDRYIEDADFRWRQLRQIGLPYIFQPMECPGALHGANAGIWSAANLSPVAGSGTQQTLQVAITYYDGSKYIAEGNTFNAESGPSAILPFVQAAGTVLQVSIASLNPPNGVMDPVGTSEAPWTPLNATNYIVWVGVPGGPLFWQAAVPIATKTFTMPGDPILSGNILGAGQTPNQLLTFQNIVGRG